MEDRRVINDTYYCCRNRSEGPICVMSNTQYVMAEYDERTGDIRWQRVVNASQKEGIYNWLREHFPAKNAGAAPVPVRKKAAAAAA